MILSDKVNVTAAAMTGIHICATCFTKHCQFAILITVIESRLQITLGFTSLKILRISTDEKRGEVHT